MGVREDLVQQMKEAAKAGDKECLSVIRLVLAAVKNKEKELRREPKDEEVLQVISSMIRQGKEAIEQFRSGGRDDLVEKEEREIGILQSFLPPPLSPEELDQEIERAIQEVGADSPRDMGKVMKLLMSRLAGRVDGRTLSDKVKRRLSG